MSSLKRTPKRPSQWRSLDELENRPEFREFAEREFARPLEHEPPNSRGRRRFMQLMGASFALAGAAGCRWDKEYIVPLARRPQGTVPGQVRVYSTSCEVGGVATGLCVTTYDGRPLKVDGNPRHPSSLGGTTAQHQARILELYDPDRGQTVIRRTDKTRAPSTWRSFEEEVRPVLSTLHVQGGQGLAVLAEPSASPTRSRLKNQLLARFPQARWFDYEPVSMDHVRAGTRLAFGAPHSVTFDFAKAAVVLSLGGDVLSSAYPGSLAYARALARGRVPDQFRMTRLYAVESHFTLFGALADHRLSLRPSLFRALRGFPEVISARHRLRRRQHSSPRTAFADSSTPSSRTWQPPGMLQSSLLAPSNHRRFTLWFAASTPCLAASEQQSTTSKPQTRTARIR